jgi:hypothetical protein
MSIKLSFILIMEVSNKVNNLICLLLTKSEKKKNYITATIADKDII